jgi:hypothetical protein
MIQPLNSRAHARIGWLLISPVLLAWLGCADVTEPVDPPNAYAAAALAQVLPPDAGGAIEDALDRVLPAMSEGAGSKGLETALAALLEALSHGAPGAAMAFVESAERALEEFARGVEYADGDAVHIDVIALALVGVRGAAEGK